MIVRIVGRRKGMLKMGFTDTVVLASATPVTRTYEINAATDWVIVLSNTGPGDLNILKIARSPLGGIYETDVAISVGIPLVTMTKMTIEGNNEPVRFLQVTFTSTVGTTIEVEGSGN